MITAEEARRIYDKDAATEKTFNWVNDLIAEAAIRGKDLYEFASYAELKEETKKALTTKLHSLGYTTHAKGGVLTIFWGLL